MYPYHDRQSRTRVPVFTARQFFLGDGDIQVKTFEFVVTRHRVVTLLTPRQDHCPENIEDKTPLHQKEKLANTLYDYASSASRPDAYGMPRNNARPAF